MEYRPLGQTGLRVSCLGFGASSLGSVFRTVDETDAIRAVHTALDLGINYFDVSPYYGLTAAETVLGKALRTVRRDRYHLATKVGRYGPEKFDFSAPTVTASVDESLSRLGVDHVDVIQCHDIEYGDLDQIVDETIPALREVQARGKALHVGITGLPLAIFEEVIERTRVDTILSYCHGSINDFSLGGLIPWLEEKGVGIINASPLSMGLLTRRGPPDWHPAPAPIKKACAEAAAYCHSRGVDIARLAMQYSLADSRIQTTLVGTASAENIKKNVEWIEEPLDEEPIAEVRKILAPIEDCTWIEGRPENNGPVRGQDAKYCTD